MIRCSRRTMLGGTLATLAIPPLKADPRSADLIVRNARVYTVEPGAPAAQAFAVRDGRTIGGRTTSEA